MVRSIIQIYVKGIDEAFEFYKKEFTPCGVKLIDKYGVCWCLFA